MTREQQLTIIILALSLIFTMMTAVFGLLWRTGNRAGQTLTEIKEMQKDIAQIGTALDDHIAWHLGRRTR